MNFQPLIKFIAQYEYARALFDERASVRFQSQESISQMFATLGTTELNHSQRFNDLLEVSVVPGRQTFKEHPDYGCYGGDFIDGLSKSKIWCRFLFESKSANQFPLQDVLAFCAAAENLETWGYRLLSLLPQFREIAGAIALEESNAEVRLKQMLYSLYPKHFCDWLLLRWYFRAYISMFVLVFTGNR